MVALMLVTSVVNAQPATPANVKTINISPTHAPQGYVKVDGFVTEWSQIPRIETRALTRGEAEYDWTGPRDCSMIIQAQADEEFLYLAIEVRDNAVVSPDGKKKGDRVEVWIDAGGLVSLVPSAVCLILFTVISPSSVLVWYVYFGTCKL